MKLAALLLAAALAAPAHADDRKAEVEAFMADYLRHWNAHDAGAIVTRFYRLDADHRWNTKEGLQAEFDRLKSQGYDRSDIQSITGCILGPETAQVELRYTRLKADGSFMAPRDRISLYQLRLFPDGWRATGMSALPAGGGMECPAN